MIDRVFIETAASIDEVADALKSHGVTVATAYSDGEPQGYPHKFTADVPDSQWAEGEVTELLNDAGIVAFVYV